MHRIRPLSNFRCSSLQADLITVVLRPSFNQKKIWFSFDPDWTFGSSVIDGGLNSSFIVSSSICVVWLFGPFQSAQIALHLIIHYLPHAPRIEKVKELKKRARDRSYRAWQSWSTNSSTRSSCGATIIP